ncbi:hypothetical protein PSCICL_11390 [Pseudomonas cichorii]|nr:hypothetical protein PSCICL_11390 [Pseudomonas cichorii]
MAGTPGYMAAARPDGGGHDVQCGGTIDQGQLKDFSFYVINGRNGSGTFIPHTCCVVKPKARCYDPGSAPQKSKNSRCMLYTAARDRPCDYRNRPDKEINHGF